MFPATVAAAWFFGLRLVTDGAWGLQPPLAWTLSNHVMFLLVSLSLSLALSLCLFGFSAFGFHTPGQPKYGCASRWNVRRGRSPAGQAAPLGFRNSNLRGTGLARRGAGAAATALWISSEALSSRQGWLPEKVPKVPDCFGRRSG